MLKNLFLALMGLSGLPLLAQGPELLQHFAYDRQAPLEVKEAGVEMRGGVAIHDISYASPKGGRVPAYLVVPSGKGPFAAVIWGHWYNQGSKFLNRKEFLAEAVALAPGGVVSLLVDGPIARPGYVANPDPLNDQQVADRVQSVVDMCRGADLLMARKDVDPARVGYVGHSYHAETGAFLSGIDRRFRAFVLMAGSMSDDVTVRSKEYQEFRLKVGAAQFDAFMSKYRWADQGKYVSHAAPAVVFLQYATKEDFLTPERAREYAAVVSEPKLFKLYDAPHSLNAEARRDRIAFLAEQLRFNAPDAAVIAKIPDLPQPPVPAK